MKNLSPKFPLLDRIYVYPFYLYAKNKKSYLPLLDGLRREEAISLAVFLGFHFNNFTDFTENVEYQEARKTILTVRTVSFLGWGFFLSLSAFFLTLFL